MKEAEKSDEWPPDFFDLCGSWEGELERPPELPVEVRDSLIERLE